jgi:hypothetical protein
MYGGVNRRARCSMTCTQPLTSLDHAQEAGAVRADISTPGLILLLKRILDVSADTADPALRDRVFAVFADGLRRSR